MKLFKASKDNKAKKTIYIVGTNGLLVRYGGWDMLLHHLTLILSKDYEIYVYTSMFEALKGVKEHNGASIKVLPLKANGIQSIFYDFFAMMDASICRADHILVLGVSGGFFFPLFKFFKSKVILNPDGAEWKRSKFGSAVKRFLKLSERLGVAYADKVISDNRIIADDVMNDYGVRSSVVEYGGDHVCSVRLSNGTADLYNIKAKDYAFKVCRIVPENNIAMILKAFSETNYKLIVIGNWSNSQFGVNTRNQFSKYSNLKLLDPIYDQQALDELRSNCKLYIHGHSVGGTNPSLVEAMYLGLPCLVYDVNYNRETTEDCAEYFSSESDVYKALDRLWDSDNHLSSISLKLQEIAKRRYCWEEIVEKYRLVFEAAE